MKPATPVNSSLSNFDFLPDSGFVRLPVVIGLCGCSPATIWRWVKSEKFPAPKKFGARIAAWNVGEIRAALKTISAS